MKVLAGTEGNVKTASVGVNCVMLRQVGTEKKKTEGRGEVRRDKTQDKMADIKNVQQQIKI